jgi:hypothetical protein
MKEAAALRYRGISGTVDTSALRDTRLEAEKGNEA